MTVRKIKTQCCVVGGGPAGMMLGLLLARAGVDVVVLEKHADFLRDFRGDTIHPSTLELMHELDWYDEFLELPHQKVATLGVDFGGAFYRIADFRHLPTRAKFIALMPQWDFLDFLADKARAYKSFQLLQRTEASGLIEEDGVVRGVIAESADGTLHVSADLVVGADGRCSTVRAAAGLKVKQIGAPMDVLWFRLSKLGSDPDETAGRVEAGQLVIMLNRGSYWQCALVIGKGGMDRVRSTGLPAFRDDIERAAPFLAGRSHELADWDQIKLLSVSVDRLEKWARPGLLCIGDAAHAMSPVGGVGINLAVQDAVATANILAEKLRLGSTTLADLEAVEKRRLWPARMTQGAQVAVQDNMISPLLSGGGDNGATMRAPLAIRIMSKFPLLQRIPARLVGIGVRAEHVRTSERRQNAKGT